MARRVWSFKNYRFSLLLFLAIILGGVLGQYAPDLAQVLKPLGDIFLNLLLTVVMPLVFFSVAAAIAQMKAVANLWQITFRILAAFIVTGLIAAILMLLVVLIFPPAQFISQIQVTAFAPQPVHLARAITGIFTVTDFYQLFSYKNMLPLLVFSMLVGCAVLAAGNKGKSFARFLNAGMLVFLKVIDYVMYLAPVGFFAYFSNITAQTGDSLVENYLRVSIIYYVTAILYFILVYSAYVYYADRRNGLRRFWGDVPVPALTALATCSSAASIPANLQAAAQMQIKAEIYETAVPLGAVLHKDGSVLGGMLKIAFLFGVYHLPFTGLPVFATAILVAALVGTVMGAIPSGGMLGELLILACYGFPPQALMIIAVISIIIDPLATLLNVTGDIVCCMLVERMMRRRQ